MSLRNFAIINRVFGITPMSSKSHRLTVISRMSSSILRLLKIETIEYMEKLKKNSEKKNLQFLLYSRRLRDLWQQKIRWVSRWIDFLSRVYRISLFLIDQFQSTIRTSITRTTSIANNTYVYWKNEPYSREIFRSV